MDEHLRKQTTKFMGVLKALGLSKDEIIGVSIMLKTEDNMAKVLDELEERDFQTTPQETLNICAHVIKENLK